MKMMSSSSSELGQYCNAGAIVRLPGVPPRRVAFDGSEEGLCQQIVSTFGIPSLDSFCDSAILVCDGERPHQYRRRRRTSSFSTGGATTRRTSSLGRKVVQLEGDDSMLDHVFFENNSINQNNEDSHDTSWPSNNIFAGRKNMEVEVLWRLRGGKGGFGALLKKLTGGGKKTTNTDAMRDLNGRRLRHAKTVERFQEWMQKKKDEDDIVAMLNDGDLPEAKIAKKKEVTLGEDFLGKLAESGQSKLAMLKAARGSGQPIGQGLHVMSGGGSSSSSSSYSGLKRASAREVDPASLEAGLSDASTDVGSKRRGKWDDNMEDLFAEFMEDASDASVSSDSDEELNIRTKGRGNGKATSSAANSSSTKLSPKRSSINAGKTHGANGGNGNASREGIPSGEDAAGPSANGHYDVDRVDADKADALEQKDRTTTPPADEQERENPENKNPKLSGRAAKRQKKEQTTTSFVVNESIVVRDFSLYKSARDLERQCGEEILKHSCAFHGLKFGGRATERATRLWELHLAGGKEKAPKTIFAATAAAVEK
ncbi:unnamed protein product [Amoebophrya sp. A25]|nr:unnamed protein product [Amoebophrya sp. A25]|eukprot:GSA25T00017241001.1